MPDALIVFLLVIGLAAVFVTIVALYEGVIYLLEQLGSFTKAGGKQRRPKAARPHGRGPR